MLLVVLGVASYSLTGRTSLTAMIPAFFGAAFLVCAMIARRGDAARRHAMHVAVAIGMVGLLAALARALDRKSTRLNSSHVSESRMPSSA